jgi:hypothetical protein
VAPAPEDKDELQADRPRPAAPCNLCVLGASRGWVTIAWAEDEAGEAVQQDDASARVWAREEVDAWPKVAAASQNDHREDSEGQEKAQVAPNPRINVRGPSTLGGFSKPPLIRKLSGTLSVASTQSGKDAASRLRYTHCQVKIDGTLSQTCALYKAAGPSGADLNQFDLSREANVRFAAVSSPSR